MPTWSPENIDRFGNVAFPVPSELDELRGPFELLELKPDEERWIAPRMWDMGFKRIQPKDRPAKDIVMLRLYVDESAPKGAKNSFPPYWDLGAQTLIAQILPYLLPDNTVQPVFLHVQKQGKGRTARFRLTVEPRAK